ncbi:hypothetical protein Bbelb_116770 [Branchiostoma belcheri]|nr:hypothetical protein Bbelb_116770 [Branchiostoma belcheri]
MGLTTVSTPTTTSKDRLAFIPDYRYYHYKIGLVPFLSPLGILHYTDYSDFTTAAQTLFFIILTTDTTGTTTTKSGFPFLSPQGILHYTDYSDFTTAAQTLFFIILTTDTTGTTTTKSGFPFLSPLGVLHYTDYSDFTTAAQTLSFIILTTDTTGTTTTKSGFPFLSPLGILHYTDYTDFTTAAKTLFFIILTTDTTVRTTDTTGTTTTKSGFPFLSPLGILHYTNNSDFTTAAQTLFFIILTTDTTGYRYYRYYHNKINRASHFCDLSVFFTTLTTAVPVTQNLDALPAMMRRMSCLPHARTPLYRDLYTLAPCTDAVLYPSHERLSNSGAASLSFQVWRVPHIRDALPVVMRRERLSKSGAASLGLQVWRFPQIRDAFAGDFMTAVTNVYRNPAQHHSDCKSGVSRKIRDALPVVMRRTVSAARSNAVVSGCVNAGAVYPSAFAGGFVMAYATPRNFGYVSWRFRDLGDGDTGQAWQIRSGSGREIPRAPGCAPR